MLTLKDGIIEAAEKVGVELNLESNSNAQFVDIEKFPKLVIRTLKETFPNELKIIMKGSEYSPKQENSEQTEKEKKIIDLQASFSDPAKFVYVYKMWTEADFKDSGEYKQIKIDMPFSLLVEVRAYARRDDFTDDTEATIEMFTTTQNYTQTSGSSINLYGVWSKNITISKQTIDASYALDYLLNATSFGQIDQVMGQIGVWFAQLSSEIIGQLPSPKAIASKLAGPLAAEVQRLIALGAEQYAKFKPTIDLIVKIATITNEIAQDPSKILTYLPFLINLAMQYVDQEEVSKLIYPMKGA